jgi:hypothetical protein
MPLTLTLADINILLDVLHAHFAGDVALGALAWSHDDDVAALRVLDKLIDAAHRVKKGTSA